MLGLLLFKEQVVLCAHFVKYINSPSNAGSTHSKIVNISIAVPSVVALKETVSKPSVVIRFHVTFYNLNHTQLLYL